MRRRMMMQSGGGRLPSEYQEVEYLESSGTQYIATNFVMLKNCDGFSATLAENKTQDSNGFIIGAENTNYVQLYWSTHLINILNGRATTIRYGFSTYKDTNYHKIGYFDNQNDGYRIELDGEVVRNGAYSRNTLTSPFYIFATCVNGVAKQFGSNFPLAEVEFFFNGNTICDFIPCYRKADHEAGMYDIVNGVFYTNQGTGEFIVGADVK